MLGAVLLAVVGTAHRAADDQLNFALVAVDIAVVFVVLMYARRLRAAQRGDERLERHNFWRVAPAYYATGWLLVAGFAAAIVSRDEAGPGALAAFAGFVVLWIVADVLLIHDRRIELRATDRDGASVQ